MDRIGGKAMDMSRGNIARSPMGFSVKYLRLFSCTAASPFLSVKYKQKDYTLLFVLRNRKMYSPCDASDHIAAAEKSQGGLHLLLLRDCRFVNDVRLKKEKEFSLRRSVLLTKGRGTRLKSAKPGGF